MSWWPSFGSSSSADKGVSSAPAPAEPTTTFGASPSPPPPTPTTRVEDENAANYLRNASFSQPSPSSAPSAERIASASDVLGAGSTSAFDISKLHPMAQLGSDSIEYLMLEDDKKNNLPGSETALPSRGWSDDLCYGTGTTYLSGLALGGAWGIREGAGRKLAVSSARLRLNSILNSVTRRGSFMGNSAGVLALIYNGINSSIDAYRGKHDVYGGMAAGGITGALFKSTAGVRPALAAATLMTSAAGIWSFTKRKLL